MALATLNPSGPLQIPGYYLAPTGGKVVYLHSSGGAGLSELPAGIQDSLFTNLNAAMAVCRDNRGDVIITLPGHTQSIATATDLSNIKAGVTVACVGNGDERPTFSWTAAASQWLISKANVQIVNARLDFAGTAATTVTLAIDVTAARFVLNACEIILGKAGGAQKAAIGVRYSAGADRAWVAACELNSTADAAFTDGFLVNAAIDRFRFTQNFGAVGPAGTNGCVRATAAATNILVDQNQIMNILAGGNSTAVFVGFAGLTGMFNDNRTAVQNDGVNVNQHIVTLGNARLNQNFGADEPAKQGTQVGTAVAT